jgi:hypothetical protein
MNAAFTTASLNHRSASLVEPCGSRIAFDAGLKSGDLQIIWQPPFEQSLDELAQRLREEVRVYEGEQLLKRRGRALSGPLPRKLCSIAHLLRRFLGVIE